MLKELRDGLKGCRKNVEYFFGRIAYCSEEGDDGGVYENIMIYYEKNCIFNMYLNIVCRDINLDDREAVLDALKADRNKVKDFLDDTTKNEYDPHEVKCAKYALWHYDDLIRKLEEGNNVKRT